MGFFGEKLISPFSLSIWRREHNNNIVYRELRDEAQSCTAARAVPKTPRLGTRQQYIICRAGMTTVPGILYYYVRSWWFTRKSPTHVALLCQKERVIDAHSDAKLWETTRLEMMHCIISVPLFTVYLYFTAAIEPCAAYRMLLGGRWFFRLFDQPSDRRKTKKKKKRPPCMFRKYYVYAPFDVFETRVYDDYYNILYSQHNNLIFVNHYYRLLVNPTRFYRIGAS